MQSPLSVSPDLMRAAPTLAPGSANAPTAQMRQTAEEFEASFLSFMLKPMFEGIETDGPFGGGHAESTWRSFMIDAMARETSRAGGIGLADTVMAEMMRMQEASAAQGAPA